ncbi:MAG: hypothetical protein L6Q54_01565 [Leptospiraceae bacterium]|nr:hypothetical protein [Leptospiraceae bacterium]MCK6379926.1 hypothetical protein [Leptospiraceae bacterium]NUM42495.1 hypothetical protein [Leptospiraceae bacterium]
MKTYLRIISKSSIKLTLFVLFLALSNQVLYPQEISIRKVSPSDYVFDSYSDEGYFQGWNLYFYNKEYHIFITFLVSNLGPNDLNHGVSLFLQSRKTGTKFYTKEFGVKTLQAKRGSFGQRSYDNFMLMKEDFCEIYVNTGEAKLHLKFKTKPIGVALSSGKFIVKPPEKFVRADIPFAFSEVSGKLNFNNEEILLNGIGGMEHLNTNYEVYKYSKRWEILRGKSKEGHLIFTGGFIGNKNFPGEFFKTIAVVSPTGEVILSGKVKRVETLKESFEPFSEYTLPTSENIYLSDDSSCYISTEIKESLGKIYVISNVSPVLRFFVRLFFAKPYQLHYTTQIKINCPEKIPFTEGKGIHSFYLINK